MQKFVFWSGVYNIVAGFSLFFPMFYELMRIRHPNSVFWSEAFGFFVICLGILLVICSRDLKSRASLVYWEGVFRLIFFAHMTWFGVMKDFGLMLAVFGVIDLFIGLVYLIGLPRVTGKSPTDLLTDM